MTPNRALAQKMIELGYTQEQLAEEMNVALRQITGSTGNVSARTIWNLLHGRTRRPIGRTRVALEHVFDCSIKDLGFDQPSPTPSEESVLRRTFAGAAAGIAAAAALPPAPGPRIGMADVDRLDAAFAGLVAADNSHGGTVSLETRAVAFAHHAMELQAVGSASQRVRQRLYYLAAAFTGTAMWAALDAYQPDRAEGHFERAMRLAGLSGNADIQLRLWGHASVLSMQMNSPHDALAAAEAGRASSTCRRDPLARSLAAARLAGVQAEAGDERSARRSLDSAVDAFLRADRSELRPTWMAFYDQSELSGLSGLAMSRLGRHDEAEAHFHRTLGELRPTYVRNRWFYSTHLALSQLRQGDVEPACSTATSVLQDPVSDSLTGRIERLLGTFTRELAGRAPRAQATESWKEQYGSRKGPL
ncbi:helix-turn-helix domain-containing protein [Streptomyces sp. NPDC002308]